MNPIELMLKKAESRVDVLIVDDREDGLIALEAVLGQQNLNLVRAQSGREALSLLSYHDFALILLDVQMPDLDGFQTAELIRANYKYKLTPIIFITAINKDDRYIYKGYEAGAVDYIFKPFEPHILRAKVNVFIDLHLKSKKLQEQAELIRKSERQERYLKLAELEVASLKRYRSLADAIPHVVWKSDGNGFVNYFNKVWCDYTGFLQEQSMGLGWQSAIAPEDSEVVLKTWMHAMESCKPFEVECRLRRHDGEYRWHWMRAVPEIENSEVVLVWIGTCTDIHDRKLAEQRLIEAEKTAKAANTAKTHFLANMSHEIRTPLGAILGFADLMSEDQSYEDRQNSIATIRRSGQQLLRIIDEILDISKVEAGRLEIDNTEVNLPNLLVDLRSLLNVQASNKKLKLEFNIKDQIPEMVMLDPTRFRQILTNIIGNAIKFTQQGFVKVDVHYQAPQGLKIFVADSGIGIDPKESEKLFQPFVQVDSSTNRRFGGTGLGLTLSRRLAQAMQGNISLERSQLGQGSLFVIQVKADPIKDTQFVSELEPLKEQTKTANTSAGILKGVKVLVVDDAIDNQLIISSFLKSAGAEVDIANDGQEGIDKAMKGDHEMILMDIQMPNVDGYEATQRLRSSGYTKPIIALTAHALKEQRDHSLKIGCSDHLTKPVDKKSLIQHVAQFANRTTSYVQ